ncbi:DEAD-domain-containing protein [Scleroderma citrinum]
MTLVQSLVTDLLPDLARPCHASAPASSDMPRDLLVRARTGTGKTLAFLIPAVENRLKTAHQHAEEVVRSSGLSSAGLVSRAGNAFRRTSPGPLILSPTRELAVQIANVVLKLTEHHPNFQVRLLVGGASKTAQLSQWKSSCRDIVVATPGRMRDLLENERDVRESMRNCNFLILDEADTLLDMGFRDDIDAITRFLAPPDMRQTFLFSATLSQRIRQIATALLSPNHRFLDASPPTSDTPLSPTLKNNARVPWALQSDDELTTHAHIPQYYTPLPSIDAQIPTLLRLIAHDQLSHGPESKIVIFCPTTHSTAFFSTILRELASDGSLPLNSTRIIEMHSKLTQAARQRASNDFRGTRLDEAFKGRSRDKRPRQVINRPTILVTSDVSARGVDYPNVTRVIQLGVPSSESLYVHRVGRTGRGSATLGPSGQPPSSTTSISVDDANITGEPRHRADLLLLPWETGYLHQQLTQFPIKALSVDTLSSQVAALASAPSCRYRGAAAIYGTSSTTDSTNSATEKPSDPLSSRFTSFLPLLDAEAVRQAASSLLGHYLPLAASLRVQPGKILDGIAAWSGMFGVDMGRPSESWLRRMGIRLENKDGSKRKNIGDLVSSSTTWKGTRRPSTPRYSKKSERGGWQKKR